MDEVLVERQPVDPQHPASGRIDPGDVVASVHDHDPEAQVEQQLLGSFARVGRDLDVPARRPDGGIELARTLLGRPGRQGPSERQRRSALDAPVDPQPTVILVVETGHRRHRLGRPQDQPTAVAQREPEGLERGALHRHGEVDEDVAAQDQVDPGEWRPRPEVVLTERHQAPERLDDLVPAVGLREIAFANGGWHLLQRRSRVDAAAGEGDRRAVDVGREDAHVEGGTIGAQGLRQRDREGVRLLAGRAAGRPDAKLTAVGQRLVDERGQGVVAEVLEHLRIAEEFGHLDEQAADQPRVLLGVVLDQVGVLGQGCRPSSPPSGRGAVGRSWPSCTC